MGISMAGSATLRAWGMKRKDADGLLIITGPKPLRTETKRQTDLAPKPRDETSKGLNISAKSIVEVTGIVPPIYQKASSSSDPKETTVQDDNLTSFIPPKRL